ncbi:hypothetical protein ACOMHN_015208 [Nucella lapillus]
MCRQGGQGWREGTRDRGLCSEASNEACDAAARSSEATGSVNAAMDDTTVDACTSSKNRDGNSSLKNTSVDHVNDRSGEERILPDSPLQPQACT